jgi:hypothetical protein
MSMLVEGHGVDDLRSTDDDESYDEETVEEDILEEDDEEEVFSLDDRLQEKLTRIEVLEQANRLKDEKLEQLQRQMNEREIKHKEGIYWFQLELDNARREKEASEEQMGELYNDLQGMMKQENNKAQETAPDGELQNDNEVHKYQQAMAVLDNQISMVKTSCGEIVKTLKEEISDLMEDRCRVELDLLNQLASLDNEKANKEHQYSQELSMKNQAIQRLSKTAVGTESATTLDADIEEYETEIGRLMEAKKKVEDRLYREREEADEEMQRLEDKNSKLEQKLEVAVDDLAVLRSGQNAQETVKALDMIAKEREGIVATLERVMVIWEKTDASALNLEDAMDQLRPDDDVPIKGDSERLLSTLESVSLVHGQVKVSLLLIELKLRNQLQSLKNDKLSMAWAAPSDEEIVKNMNEIQKEALVAVAQVEGTLSQQIREMGERALEETKLLKNAIQQRTETLVMMQSEHKGLEEQITKLKTSNGVASDFPLVADDEMKSPDTPANGITKQVVDQLQTEVLRIVERVKENNETIEALKAELEEYRARELHLKKEPKIVSSHPTKAEATKEPRQEKIQISTVIEASPISPTKSAVKSRSSVKSPKHSSVSEGSPISLKRSPVRPSKCETVIAESPLSPTRSPVKSSKCATVIVEARPISTPRSQVKSSKRQEHLLSPVKTPNQGIAPLRPSPREISKPRISPLAKG